MFPISCMGRSPHKSLAANISEWQAGTVRVFTGGLTDVTATDAALSGGADAAGKTYISGVAMRNIIQDGYVRRVVANVAAVGPANGWKFKVFRWNGSTYLYISESELITPAGTGVQTFDLATPMACNVGDVLGVWLKGDANSASIRCTLSSGTAKYRSVSADVTGSNNFSSSGADYEIDLQAFSNPPYLALSGDSIMEGHGGAMWHGIECNTSAGVAGDRVGDPGYLISQAIPGLQYQNRAQGSSRSSWGVSTGVPHALSVLPHTLVINWGVNDIANAISWNTYLANLDAIKALVDAASPKPELKICEVLPWKAGDDAMAANVRTFNANLSGWCAANGASLILCHDEMGKLRNSTGYLDDMQDAYDNGDGVHLSAAGTTKYAAIIARYL